MEDYIEEIKIIEKTDKEKENELIISIIKAKNELNLAMKNFEYAEDDLIDFYIYKIKATRSKYDYLLRIAKQKELSFDIVNQIRVKYNNVV